MKPCPCCKTMIPTPPDPPAHFKIPQTLVICVQCGLVSAYDNDQLRKTTEDEFDALIEDPTARRAYLTTLYAIDHRGVSK